ncbi:MAG TPA: chorismate mutase [Woeseiaceae bacterium]|nr:chorismate mutase [Woeseiaceae bacterium]
MTSFSTRDTGDGLERAKDIRLLEPLRSELDAINLQLLERLEARGRLVREVLAVKRRLGVSVYDPEREQTMIEELLRCSADVYPRSALVRIFSAIFSASRALMAEAPVDCRLKNDGRALNRF